LCGCWFIPTQPIRDTGEIIMQEHIIIKDDKGKKHTFYNLKELIDYLDSFKMSFLPDNFSYEIKDKE
jgi:hypothetical protein